MCPPEDLSAARGTIVELDEAAAENFAWGAIQWLVNDSRNPGAAITAGHVMIYPGQHNPLHYHPNADEVLHLIEGELEHRIGEERFRLSPGSTIYVPRGVWHNAVNTGNVTARMLVTYPTGHREMILVDEGIGPEA
jgi:quercetin dioxygenase-like cupin family protein